MTFVLMFSWLMCATCSSVSSGGFSAEFSSRAACHAAADQQIRMMNAGLQLRTRFAWSCVPKQGGNNAD